MKRKVVYCVVVVGLMFLAVFTLDFSEVFVAFRQVPLWLVFVLLGMQVVTQLLINFQWFKIASFFGLAISFWQMQKVNCQGVIIDAITPGVKVGGEVTRAMRLKKVANCSLSQASSIVVLQKFLSLNALFLILSFSFAYFIGAGSWTFAAGLQLLIYGISVLFLVASAGIFLFCDRLSLYFAKKSESRWSFLVRVRGMLCFLLQQLLHLRQDGWEWARLFLLSFFIWLFYPVKMYVLAVHFVPDIEFLFLTAIVFLAYMMAMLPIFPGGLGGFEGVMVGLFLMIGLDLGVAVVISVFFRFVTFWFVTLAGGIFLATVKVINFTTVKRGGNFGEREDCRLYS